MRNENVQKEWKRTTNFVGTTVAAKFGVEDGARGMHGDLGGKTGKSVYSVAM
jgi:hypothetical protein